MILYTELISVSFEQLTSYMSATIIALGATIVLGLAYIGVQRIFSSRPVLEPPSRIEPSLLKQRLTEIHQLYMRFKKQIKFQDGIIAIYSTLRKTIEQTISISALKGETEHEYLTRLMRALETIRGDMAELYLLYERARFSGSSPTETQLETTSQLSSRIVKRIGEERK